MNCHYLRLYVWITAACTTITVSKCQAALRTLRGFDYFSPTCLCKEPHIDPKCNQLRDFIFDHPCEIASTNYGKNT